MRKITTLLVHHIFWYKIFAARHEDNVKPPPATFYVFLSLKLDIRSSRVHLQKNPLTFHKVLS